MALEHDCRVPVQAEQVVVARLVEEPRSLDAGDGALVFRAHIDELERHAAVHHDFEIGG